MRVVVLLLTLLSPAREALSEPPRISFASLSSGARLTVRYSSTGCFHSVEKELVFSGLPDQPGRIQVRIQGHDNRMLPEETVQGLDMLLEFYRALPAGWVCTTEDQIHLELAGGPGDNIREEYSDMTCQAPEQPGVVTFDELLRTIDVES